MRERGLLLDTCAAIWLVSNAPMAEEALAVMERWVDSGGELSVSPITAWEVGMLVSKGRLSLALDPRSWFATLMAGPGVTSAPMDADILISSSFLPGDLLTDPADRIVAATARQQGLRIVTRDRKLLDYSALGHVEVIPC